MSASDAVYLTFQGGKKKNVKKETGSGLTKHEDGNDCFFFFVKQDGNDC